MKKAALKKELREIDRQLARFGVIYDATPNVPYHDYPLHSMLHHSRGPEKNDENIIRHPVTDTKMLHLKRQAQCRLMGKKIKEMDLVQNSINFTGDTTKAIRCKGFKDQNTYGLNKQETRPYLWPLLEPLPSDVVDVNGNVNVKRFCNKAANGTLTDIDIEFVSFLGKINAEPRTYTYGGSRRDTRQDVKNSTKSALERAADEAQLDMVKKLVNAGATINPEELGMLNGLDDDAKVEECFDYIQNNQKNI
mgnify:CR=1 FL=1